LFTREPRLAEGQNRNNGDGALGGDRKALERFIQGRRQPYLRAPGEVEPLRHDADHGAWLPVERNLLPNRTRIAGQAVPPEGVAYECDRRRVGSLFVRGKVSSRHRPHPEYPEKRARHERHIQLLRRLDAGPVHSSRDEGCNIFEDAVFTAQIKVVWRDADVLLSRSRPLADPVDPIGIGVSQRSDQNRIGHAEDRRIRADANSQRKGGGESKKRIAPQAAHGVGHVLPDALKPRRQPDGACSLSRLSLVAHRTPRGVTGRRRPKSAFLEFALRQSTMELHLLGQFRGHSPVPQQVD